MIQNQSNYQDNQNYQIDINGIYQDFIKEIDAVRSFVNISNGTNQQILNNFTVKNITNLNNLLKIEDSPQESRCHAFFRLIGFPVVSVEGTLYNAGLDNIFDAGMKLSLEDKITIAKKPIPGFNKLSVERETYVSKIRNIFLFNKSIDAATLSLSSGVNIRPFNASLTKIDTSSTSLSSGQGAFSTKKEDQSYTVDFNSRVGTRLISLFTYQDVNGTFPSKLERTRSHIILPFLVDSRIDFTVSPSANKIAVPFVFHKINTRIDEVNYARRPLLEKIIRDRFTVNNQIDSTGTANRNLFEIIKNNPNFRNQEIINRISKNDVYKLSEQLQFLNFFNILKAMMVELINAQKSIDIAQSKYYYVPVPSITGPEGGCSSRGVFLTTNLSPDLITENDQNIINSTIITTTNQINSQVAGANGISDLGGFAFDSFKTTFNSDTTESLGNISSDNLKELINTRDKFLQRANEGLRTIEIITGEFSGLGLCDIIAVMGALYIMPKDHLMGFLDSAAKKRMESILKISPANIEISTAMNSLVNNVKDFYNLAEKIYQDLRQNNGK